MQASHRWSTTAKWAQHGGYVLIEAPARTAGLADSGKLVARRADLLDPGLRVSGDGAWCSIIQPPLWGLFDSRKPRQVLLAAAAECTGIAAAPRLIRSGEKLRRR